MGRKLVGPAPNFIVAPVASLKLVLLAWLMAVELHAQPLNLVFLGDSLTEGVPHLNGEVDTYAFQTAQAFTGSTYTKLGYRGQTTDYLRGHLDAFLFSLLKSDYRNVLVLWAGTNDCAIGPLDCAQPVYQNLAAIARTAQAVGWKVIAVTIIARGNYFADAAHERQFPANQLVLNNLLRSSRDFDAVVDPATLLPDPTNANYFWDGCHLRPSGYQMVAQLVIEALKNL